MNVSKTRKNKKGSVLAIAVALVAFLFVIGIALLQTGASARLTAARTTAEISARSAADAGITHALNEMNKRFEFGKMWDNSWIPFQSPDISLGNSYAGYSFNIAGPGPVNNLWSVTSTGTSARASKTVNSFVRLRSLFDYALIVNERIILKNDILIDGYDSDDGYDPANPSLYLKIGTNSILDDMIVLNNNVTVKGDILVGVEGIVEDVIKDLGATTGPRYNLPREFLFEPILVPDSGPSIGAIDTNNLEIGAPGTTTYVKCDSINIRNTGDSLNPGRLDVEGEVHLHVTGDIRLNQSAEIRVTPNSSLVIYLDGDLTAGQSNGINNMTLIPANFVLFGTGSGGQKWVIQNGGDFYGVYYAPNADIDIYAKADIYGSVSGYSFELKAGGDLHYDVSLSKLVPYKVGFGIERWWEQ